MAEYLEGTDRAVTTEGGFFTQTAALDSIKSGFFVEERKVVVNQRYMYRKDWE